MHIRVNIEMKCYTKNELRTHNMHIVDFNYILLINFFYLVLLYKICLQSAAISCCMFVLGVRVPFTHLLEHNLQARNTSTSLKAT